MTRRLWIEQEEALVLHGMLLAEHGGPPGVRDPGLLTSALARPKQHATYGRPGVHELAAIYTNGIVRNHPFVDGNKRTGFLIGTLFLELNGFRFRASEEEAARTVIALAAGQTSEDEYVAFLKSHSTRT